MAGRSPRQLAVEKRSVPMTRFKEVVLAGAALCCVVFALDISTPPQMPSPEHRDTDRTIVTIAAPDFQVERDAGSTAVGSSPATDEPHSSQPETEAVVDPITRQPFASFDKAREPKHVRHKRAARRVSPRSIDPRVATAQVAIQPTWNDSGWSWNQSWRAQSDMPFHSSSARQSSRRSAGYSGWSSWRFDPQRRDSPNSCPWC
jgi:hypothetical protein